MDMLTISDLTSGYGPVQVLHGVSLQVAKGEIIAVLGPNGAGKSTLLNTLVGLVPARTGAIHFNAEPIAGRPPETILQAGIALVPEGRRVFAGLSVLDNLRMGAYLERDARIVNDRLTSVFDRFTILKERRQQLAGTLSGGEQQQLAIARALMSRPSLMLLDEPSLGLAPVIIDVVLDLIRELRETGLTVLLVEQNIHQALEIADRAYVMATGTIQLEGRCEELRRTGLELERTYLGETG